MHYCTEQSAEKSTKVPCPTRPSEHRHCNAGHHSSLCWPFLRPSHVLWGVFKRSSGASGGAGSTNFRVVLLLCVVVRLTSP